MGIAMPGTICNPFLKGSFLKGAHPRIAFDVEHAFAPKKTLEDLLTGQHRFGWPCSGALAHYWSELATLENALLAFDPTSRMVPTTSTRITANITAYSAMPWPSSSAQNLSGNAVMKYLPISFSAPFLLPRDNWDPTADFAFWSGVASAIHVHGAAKGSLVTLLTFVRNDKQTHHADQRRQLADRFIQFHN
jgi:hypothetical protein